MKNINYKAEWTHSENNIKKGWHILTGQFDDVINIPNGSDAEAKANFIVTACNLHSELIEALQAAKDKIFIEARDLEDTGAKYESETWWHLHKYITTLLNKAQS